MREFLTYQMNEKKKFGEFEKKLEKEQLEVWNRENGNFFSKEKETNEKVKYYINLYKDKTVK